MNRSIFQIKRQALLILGVLFVSACHKTTVNNADMADIAFEDWLIERSLDEFELPQNRMLFVENRYGDIRIRTSNDNVITLSTVVQRHGTDTASPHLDINETGNVMKLTVVYPENSDQDASLDSRFLDKRRVDISLLAPAKANLVIETASGLAESKGHMGPLRVQTKNGLINIVTKGPLDAKSEHGDIRVIFRNRDFTESSVLETNTGDIQVTLMERANIDVHAETAGFITTDYSIVIEPEPGSSYKRAEAQIGNASQTIKISSNRGAISLGRLFDLLSPNTENLVDGPKPSALIN